MAFRENEGLKILDKFNGENFNLWKFKMEMILASRDLWDIVDESEEAPPSDANLKDKKAFEKQSKTAFGLIAINLVDKEMAHIKHCKGPTKAWKILCNIHETKSLSNILFLRYKFFIIKMQEADDIFDHINKVKSLVDQLTCLEVAIKDEDVVITLLDSLPTSYEHLITALETRPMKELILEFVTARLMHEVNKRKEKEPQGDEATMVTCQTKRGSTNKKHEPRMCFKYGKQGHIIGNCWSGGKDVANNAKVDDCAFVVTNKALVATSATQHMTLHRQAFDIYEAISNHHMFLGDNGIVEAVGKGSILVETEGKEQIKRIAVHNVLHVPKLHANLLLVSKLASKGLKVHFNMVDCVVRAQSGEMLAMASMEANLYHLQLKKVNRVELSTLTHTSTNGDAMEF